MSLPIGTLELKLPNGSVIGYKVPVPGGGFRTFSTVKEAEKGYATAVTEYSDPSENFLNNLMFGGAGVARAAATGGLLWLDNTVKEWVPKLSFSSAYQTGTGLAATPTTGAVAADAVMTAVPTGLAASDIILNGATAENVTNTALGLFPIFGAAKNSYLGSTFNNNVQKAVSSLVSRTPKSFRDYTIGRAMNTTPMTLKMPILIYENPQMKLVKKTKPGTSKARYVFSERSSNLTEAERAGIPKGERNNLSKPLKDFGVMEVIDNTYLVPPYLTLYIGGGGESWVYSTPDRVYKVMRSPLVGLSGYNNFNQIGFSRERIGDFIRQYINTRNRHPVFEPIKFEGVVHMEDQIYPVISLRKLIALPSAIPSELVKVIGKEFLLLMDRYNYKPVSGLLGGLGRGYRNNIGTISDIGFKNLGYTPEGDLRLLDVLAEKNGGKIK